VLWAKEVNVKWVFLIDQKCVEMIVYISYVQSTAQSKVLCDQIYLLAIVQAAYILTASPYFDNLQFDIFDAGGPYCNFIISVLCAGRVPCVH